RPICASVPLLSWVSPISARVAARHEDRLSHANLIDCVEPKIRPDSAVLIEDGRIRAILPSGEAGSVGDAQMIDLKGGYLIPGLWDVHIHPDYLSLDEMPLADQVSSRPEEFHLRALPEPCMTLSSHTAPDVRPLPERLCLVHGLLLSPVGQ